MRNDLVSKLQCATCGSEHLHLHTIESKDSVRTEKGFIYCDRKHWFPIEDGVLEFLPPELCYKKERDEFRVKNLSALAQCGLDSETSDKSNISVSIKEEVLNQQQHFDWYAENDAQSYDEYSHMPFWDAVDTWTFDRWRKRISANDLVLDVGCAQGRACLQIIEKSPNIIGIDISKKLIKKAYQNFEKAGYSDKSDFFVADGSHPPFKNGIFDCVMIYGVLHHLPDPGVTCREVARIIKDNGIFLSSENNQSAFRSIFDLLMKISSLWHEEAGAQPLLSRQDIFKWFAATGVKPKTSTIVFLPPHLINLLPRTLGRKALQLTDKVFGMVPFLREQGGLLVIEGQKSV